MMSGWTVVTKRIVQKIWCQWGPILVFTQHVYVYKNTEENVSLSNKKLSVVLNSTQKYRKKADDKWAEGEHECTYATRQSRADIEKQRFSQIAAIYSDKCILYPSNHCRASYILKSNLGVQHFPSSHVRPSTFLMSARFLLSPNFNA